MAISWWIVRCASQLGVGLIWRVGKVSFLQGTACMGKLLIHTPTYASWHQSGVFSRQVISWLQQVWLLVLLPQSQAIGMIGSSCPDALLTLVFVFLVFSPFPWTSSSRFVVSLQRLRPILPMHLEVWYRCQTLVFAWFALCRLWIARCPLRLRKTLTRSANKDVQLDLAKHWSYYAIYNCKANVSLT